MRRLIFTVLACLLAAGSAAQEQGAAPGNQDPILATRVIQPPVMDLDTSLRSDAEQTFFEAVIAVNRSPQRTGFTRVRLILIYEGEPTGCTVDVGDSVTNGGGGGDAGTQSRDAEMQIRNNVMSVFPSNPHAIGSFQDARLMLRDGTMQVTVSDMYLDWMGADQALQFEDGPDILDALGGQPDLEGPVNNNLYAGLNRVIWGPNERIGSSLSKVFVALE